MRTPSPGTRFTEFDEVSIKNIGAKYKDFIDEYWNELVNGVKVGKLWLKLKLAVKLLAEKVA